MRFLKTVVLAALLLALVMLLPACASKKTGESTSAADETPAGDAAPVKLTINGSDISEYTIVYAKSEYSKLRNTKKTLRTEFDFYRMTAEDIASRISALTGVTLTVAPDTSEAAEKEILVGPTSRGESENNNYAKMSVYKYLDNVQGSKLVIGAGYNASSLNGRTVNAYTWSPTFHAFDAVEQYVTAEKEAGKSEIDLPSGLELTGKPALKTVAMIGDSITAGVGSTNGELLAYPAILQRLLWKDYIIVNLGNSGKTMRDDLPDKYNATAQYAAALKNAASFDLVTIMLGTNDSNRDRNWDSKDDETYNRSALDIAKAIKKKNENVGFMIMNCPAYYGGDAFGSKHVRDLQKELPALFEQNGHTCAFFDMYTFTNKQLTKSRFPDTLHPNDEGHYLMAERLSTVLPQVFEGNMKPE